MTTSRGIYGLVGAWATVVVWGCGTETATPLGPRGESEANQTDGGGGTVAACVSDADCALDEICESGFCERPAGDDPLDEEDDGDEGREGPGDGEGAEGAEGLEGLVAVEGSEEGEGGEGAEGNEKEEGVEGAGEEAEGVEGQGMEGIEGAGEGLEGIEGTEGQEGSGDGVADGGEDGGIAAAGDGGAFGDGGAAPCVAITESCGTCGTRTAECGPDGVLQPFGACSGGGNACGGCTELAVALGDACGECGVWVCAGPEQVKCDDPGKPPCVDYLACALKPRCGTCPDPPAEKCNGRDDDCNPLTVEEGKGADCPAGQACRAGFCCADECAVLDAKECVPGNSGYRTCGQFDADGCLEWSATVPCANNSCSNGSCACVPDCAGKACGSDGCGGSCGVCGPGTACGTGGVCQCAGLCGGKVCGDNGCGGSCGTCPAQHECEGGVCVCKPDCTGKECGNDGCGGSCGQCDGQGACVAGVCECPSCKAGTACSSDKGCDTRYLTCVNQVCECNGGFKRLDRTGHCYQAVAVPLTWTNAKAACAAVADFPAGLGHLVTIHSDEENQFVRTLTGQTSSWMGMTDLPSEGTTEGNFIWITGEAVTFKRWDFAQPDNADKKEHCAHMKSSGNWNDKECGDTMRYVCEVP